MKQSLRMLLAAVVALAATAALAEPDHFGLGSGGDSTITIASVNKVVNSYQRVTAPLAPGDTLISVGGAVAGDVRGFAPGDLVMVIQTTGIVPPPGSGAQATIDLSADPVGRFELARLSAASATLLTLSAPLVHSYASSVTQVIRMPEYTTVTINAGASIGATPWNGSTGGVIAFLASGTITNNGSIRANATGFRGGLYVDDASGSLSCTGLDEPAAQGGQKGEGIANLRYGATQSGRGNVANGGGAGICYKSGGGGGGNGGQGGLGGRSDFSFDGARLVGGLGGAVLTYSATALDHLTLGGGGGAGHGADSSGTQGGNGGGIIFIRAAALAGTGSLQATGQSPTTSGSDGASGGGAGGTVYARFTGNAACSNASSASGGIGGTVNSADFGPGGGGGGGRVIFQACAGACTISRIGSSAGIQQDFSAPDGPSYGATAGSNGVLVPLSGCLVFPATPTVVTPGNGTATNNPRPPITGTATPSVTVIVYVDGVELGRTTSDAGGNWTFTPASNLAEGAHVAAAATESLGLASPKSAGNNFTVDLTPPAAPVTLAPANGSRTNNTSPSYSGTADPGTTVTVYRDGAILGTTTATGAGTWTLTPPGSLAAGTYLVKATSTDAAGNTSVFSNTNSFTVDLTPPIAPVVVTPANNSFTQSPPSYGGTAEANSTVTVYRDGAVIGTVTADGLGNWTLAALALADGTYQVNATATDVAGNTGPLSNTNTFTLDRLAPAIPVVTSPAANDTVSTLPTYAGTAEPNSTVSVYVDGTLMGTTPANALGNWTFAQPVGSPLVDGAHGIRVQATDRAGNQSVQSANVPFNVDLTPPAVPVVTFPVDRSTIKNRTPTITGTAEPGSTVEVVLDGVTLGTAISDGSGKWTLAVTTPLSEAQHSVKARATDAFGNTSLFSNTTLFTVDVTPPAAPVVVTPLNGSITNQNRPTVTGTAEPFASVDVSFDGVSSGSATADSLGKWSYQPNAALPDGQHRVNAVASDAANNQSVVSNTNTFTVDTVPPAAPVVMVPANGATVATQRPPVLGTAVAGSLVSLFIDNVAAGTATADASGNWMIVPPTPLASGLHAAYATATDAAGNVSAHSNTNTFTVDVTAPDTTILTGPSGTVASTDATFTFSSDKANTTFQCKLDGAAAFTACTTPLALSGLAQGSHTLAVRAVDAAGTVDLSPATRTWTVDTAGPGAPVVTEPAPGATVSTGTPLITGTAEPGSTVTILIDNKPVGTATTGADGTWSFTPTTALGSGPHTVAASATDTSGNAGPASAPQDFTVSGGGSSHFAGGGLGSSVGCSATGGESALALLSVLGLLAQAAARRRAR